MRVFDCTIDRYSNSMKYTGKPLLELEFMCIRAPVGTTKLLDQGYREELVRKAIVLSSSTKIKPEAHTHLQGSDKKILIHSRQ